MLGPLQANLPRRSPNPSLLHRIPEGPLPRRDKSPEQIVVLQQEEQRVAEQEEEMMDAEIILCGHRYSVALGVREEEIYILL